MADHITTSTIRDTELPRRAVSRPRTTVTPHMQLDQKAPQPLQDTLWRRMTGLEDVRGARTIPFLLRPRTADNDSGSIAPSSARIARAVLDGPAFSSTTGITARHE
jgi:hypothetical protein